MTVRNAASISVASSAPAIPADAFVPKNNPARVTALETRVAQKDAVIAAVSEEYLALKKNTGAS